MKNNNVVFTGMGCVTPIGIGVDNFNQSLQVGKCNFIRMHSENNSTADDYVMAKLKEFDLNEELKKFSLNVELSSRLLKMSRQKKASIDATLLAATEAWVDANLINANIDSSQIGVIVAGNNPNSNEQFHLHNKFNQQPGLIKPSFSIENLDSSDVSLLSHCFQIHGESLYLSLASATGNLGLIHAYRLIQSGVLSVCMVVNPYSDLSPMQIQSFINSGAMGGKNFLNQPELASRPFDQQHDGFIPAQAATCLILENAVHAKKRRVMPKANLLSGAICLDATYSAVPNLTGEANVMKLAIDRAQLQISDIDYINTHGSSSPLGDQVELDALESVFDLSKVRINATKSITGHCLWSAGSLEAIATILQIQHHYLHPNLNLNDPIKQNVAFVGHEKELYATNYAINNSFGFGGINTAIIIGQEKLTCQ